MEDKKPATSQSVSVSTGKAFTDMNSSEKMTFIGKVVVMLITGGFAFPNVFVE